ncbi:unnamed protein product [Brassicogethes aeneus]|uniref:Transposase domain-containing protein n=1 Tax=Brassicogethes aeneus TaxID=1431903 RepID=A0A9P0FL90_BRAAE|nr:unnamed protein product [Brassicogethes aeneus]
MAWALRSEERVYLVGTADSQIRGSKLPSNKQVLSVFFYNMRNVKLNARESASLAVQNLFDIAHSEALQIIKIEEDKQFLIAQRQPGRVGCLGGIDKNFEKKENRSKKRKQEESERKRKYEQFLMGPSTSTEFPTIEDSDSDEDEAHRKHDCEIKPNEPTTPMESPEPIQPTKVIITTFHLEKPLLSSINTTVNKISNIKPANNDEIIDVGDFFENSPIVNLSHNVVSTVKSTDSTNEEFLKKIQYWACTNNLTQKCLNELIEIIQPEYPFLPNDSRTILKTPREVNRITLNNGEMIYLGIEKNIIKKIESTSGTIRDNFIPLQVNIDGIPLFKSGAGEFWPILMRSEVFCDTTPFAVAIFFGNGKPDPLEAYLKCFIDEYSSLVIRSVCYLGIEYKIKICFFSCDAPARSYLKQVMGHTSISGCERCKIKSQYEEKRRFYPSTILSEARTDDDFLNFNDRNTDTYIKSKSPLLTIGVNLVSQFVLDPMHLVHLGVMKRLLTYWLDGRRPYKFSRNSIIHMNTIINSDIRGYVTSDFVRKLRSFAYMKRWKATEYRFFLLYVGTVILKDSVNLEVYKNFLLLHCAVFILSSEPLIKNHWQEAKFFLQEFVRTTPDIYTKFFNTYNVHSLLHICDDVRVYGPLDFYSCFPFENYLGKLKRMVKGKYMPLGQIHNRLKESEKFTNKLNLAKKNNEFVASGIVNERDGYFEYDYDKGLQSLQRILDEAATTSHDTGQSNATVLTRKSFHLQSSESENDVPIKDRKRKRTKSKNKELHSNSPWSSENEQTPLKHTSCSTTVQQPERFSSFTPILESAVFMNNSQNSPLVQNREILNASFINQAFSEVDIGNAEIVLVNENDDQPNAAVPNDNTSHILEEILRHVVYIREVQDQNTLRLDQLERLNQTATVQQLARPHSVPILPINNKKEFEELENFLTEDVNLLYMAMQIQNLKKSEMCRSSWVESVLSTPCSVK